VAAARVREASQGPRARCLHASAANSGRIPSGRRKHSGAAVSLDGGGRGSPAWVVETTVKTQNWRRIAWMST
jgi:hypothetical protein